MKQISAKRALFDELYQNHIRIVYKVALDYSGNNEVLAQEVVSDAFLQLYIYLEYMKPENIKAWLICTTKNYAIAAYKKTSNNQELSRDSETLKEDRLVKLYEQNPLWYEVVILVYCMEVPADVVSLNMHLNKRAMKNLLLRARKWVEKYYDKLENTLLREAPN